MKTHYFFVDTAGHKRRGILVACKFCNHKFCTRVDQVRKFCSKTCQSKAQLRRELLLCANCGRQFDKKVSAKRQSRSGLFFCCRQCKDAAQRIGGIREIMPAHYGTGSDNEKYRRLFNEKELVCARCGYCEFACGIDIHHKDGDTTNNLRANLLPLCSPCHRALHFGLWGIDELNKRNPIRRQSYQGAH